MNWHLGQKAPAPNPSLDNDQRPTQAYSLQPVSSEVETRYTKLRSGNAVKAMVLTQPTQFPLTPITELWSDEPPLESDRHLLQILSLTTTARGWRWSEQLRLYLGIEAKKLRFFTPEGALVPAPAEAAITERKRAEAASSHLRQAKARAHAEEQRAEQERQRAEQIETREVLERQRAEQLLAQLHALGIQPNLNGELE